MGSRSVQNDHDVKWVYGYATTNVAINNLNAQIKTDVTKKKLELLIRDGVVVNHVLSTPGKMQVN